MLLTNLPQQWKINTACRCFIDAHQVLVVLVIPIIPFSNVYLRRLSGSSLVYASFIAYSKSFLVSLISFHKKCKLS